MGRVAPWTHVPSSHPQRVVDRDVWSRARFACLFFELARWAATQRLRARALPRATPPPQLHSSQNFAATSQRLAWRSNFFIGIAFFFITGITSVSFFWTDARAESPDKVMEFSLAYSSALACAIAFSGRVAGHEAAIHVLGSCNAWSAKQSASASENSQHYRTAAKIKLHQMCSICGAKTRTKFRYTNWIKKLEISSFAVKDIDCSNQMILARQLPTLRIPSKFHPPIVMTIALRITVSAGR